MVAAVTTGVISASPASAAPADRYVSTAGTDTGDCTDELNPCETINYAVSQSVDGDTVNVEAGTYDENVLVDKSLVFRGANAGIDAGVSAGIRGAESVVKSFRTGTGSTILNLYGATARDVTIDGFTVDPQGDSTLIDTTLQAGLIHLRGGATTGTSVVNNIVRGAATFIPGCTAVSCAAPNQMAPMGVTVGSGEVTISGNRIENFRYGARTQQQLGASFPALDTTFSGNVVTGVSVQGFSIGGVTGVQQPGGVITGNEIDAVGRASDPAGIVLSNAGNVVTDNSLTDLGRGVTVILCKKWDTRNNTVDDNSFDTAPLVISVSTDGGQCATGSGGDTEGVGSWVVGGGRFDGFNANNNTFTGGTLAIASSASAGFSSVKPVTAGPIDVSCNWWDDETGPTNPNNPGGTGLTLLFSTVNSQPEFNFTPWLSTSSGPCDGGAPDPELRVSIGDQQGLERDFVNGSVFMPVTLSEPAAENVVVSFYTVNGTALHGVDYLRAGTPANPRTITIPAGQVKGSINVSLLFANPDPFDKTFSVVLASVSGGDAVIGRGTGTATIIDSDALFGPNPVINVSNVAIVEGDDGQRLAQFLVHLSRPLAAPLSLSYITVDGTAEAGTDYVAKLPSTLVFPAGLISRTVDVLVNPDTVAQGDREFFLDVAITGGPAVEELNMTGVATIIDDD